jgi:5-methylcytosine-specific restriction protein A
VPSVEDFRMALRAQLYRAQKHGLSHIDVKAGDLHRRVGGHPANSHRMPSCCEAMYAEKKAGDVIISRPPEGKGATLTIRYKLPRSANALRLPRGSRP